jgi:hypothetical protein
MINPQPIHLGGGGHSTLAGLQSPTPHLVRAPARSDRAVGRLTPNVPRRGLRSLTVEQLSPISGRVRDSTRGALQRIHFSAGPAPPDFHFLKAINVWPKWFYRQKVGYAPTNNRMVMCSLIYLMSALSRSGANVPLFSWDMMESNLDSCVRTYLGILRCRSRPRSKRKAEKSAPKRVKEECSDPIELYYRSRGWFCKADTSTCKAKPRKCRVHGQIPCTSRHHLYGCPMHISNVDGADVYTAWGKYSHLYTQYVVGPASIVAHARKSQQFLDSDFSEILGLEVEQPYEITYGPEPRADNLRQFLPQLRTEDPSSAYDDDSVAAAQLYAQQLRASDSGGPPPDRDRGLSWGNTTLRRSNAVRADPVGRRPYTPPASRAPEKVVGQRCPTCQVPYYKGVDDSKILIRGPAYHNRDGTYASVWADAESGNYTGERLKRKHGVEATAHRMRLADRRYDECHPVMCECDEETDWSIPGGLEFSYFSSAGLPPRDVNYSTLVDGPEVEPRDPVSDKMPE